MHVKILNIINKIKRKGIKQETTTFIFNNESKGEKRERIAEVKYYEHGRHLLHVKIK